MEKATRIFVGSSSEALKVAQLVADAIRQSNMEPVVWNNDAFVLGMTLLETIESLPFDYHGAVLLWTPDVSCRRRGEDPFSAPVANVVFEYGYLAARLTRRRVAICRFGNADVPSDLQGMKLVEVQDYQPADPAALPPEARRELGSWLKQLPPLASGIPPVSQAHGYSGTWNVESRFSLWRGVKIEKGNKVYFDGKTFLVLQNDGEKGSGIQVGKLWIDTEGYSAMYEILNEVLSASVDEDGTLKLHIKVVRREGPKNTSGKAPDESFEEDLRNKEFDLVLKPVPGKSKRLRGTHAYKSASKVYQRAVENWEYSNLFGACCL